MWLMYPIAADDVRKARQGIVVLLAGSAVWYLTVAGVLAVWAEPVLFKVKSKFGPQIGEPERNWTPLLILLIGFVLAGGLRLLGYRLCRNVAGAVSAGDGISIALFGGVVWLGACGTVYFGFTGLLGIVAAFGTALELKYLRFPSMLFSMVVSRDAVRRVSWFFYARTVWLILVLLSGLILLGAHVIYDIPTNPGGPWEQSIRKTHGILRLAFNLLAGTAVITLPLLTAWYWLILFQIHDTVHRLLDPSGPTVDMQEPEKPGFNQLKDIIHNPL